MKAKLYFAAKQETTFTLESLIKETMTQEKLSKYLNVSRTTINQWINNPRSISIDKLEQILEVLGYDIQMVLNKRKV